MKISVASGKGGTGKTTIALNLALSLENVQLLDCDVEEPDCHLFLDFDLEEIEKVKEFQPEINTEKCNLCGECANKCFYNAIVVPPSGPMIFPDLCHSCELCNLVCPENAVIEKEKMIGKVEKGQGVLDFYQGVLATGEVLVTPLIEAVKRNADENRPMIIDVPPGTACAAVAAVEGSDFCILVTEPTPFGLHDLKYSIEMLDQQNIPYGVVINRDGIGDDRVENYCKDKDIPLLMKIPNNREIAELYSEGVPFVKALPKWRENFIDLYERIEELIS